MNRVYLLAVLVFGLIFFGLVTLQSPIVALALPFLVYLLAGLWAFPDEIQLLAFRRVSAERVLIGDDVSITLTVRNVGKTVEELLLEDQLPAGLEVVDGSNRRLLALPAGESVTWTYRIRGRRGYFALKRIRATVREPLGLITRQQELSTDGQLFILPPVLRLRRVSIQPRRTRIFSGTIPAHLGGSGVEFFDVREYQQGDSQRWINWRVTARHSQSIYTNEFEQERSADVGIILDGRHRTNDFGNRSIFEHSVLAAAAMADSLLNSGNRVGLLFYGRQVHWTMPGYGRVQGERILHDLTRLEPGDSQNFNDLYIPRHLFPSRSQLVLVSSLVPDDCDILAALRMRGYPLLVISPNPVLFEASGLRQTRENFQAMRIVKLQRRIFLRRLLGAGIQVVDWDVSQPFEAIAKRDLERRLVLPRGEPR
jgi:uncharacterized repeat protein (TIGR01451 family)